MTARLDDLLGRRQRAYVPALVDVSSAAPAVPVYGMASYSPAPAANTWQEVLVVAGAGQLRGLYVGAGGVGAPSTTVSVRLTLDTAVVTTSFTISGSSSGSVALAAALFQDSGGCGLDLGVSYPFASLLKIEVKRTTTSASVTVRELHELEAA